MSVCYKFKPRGATAGWDKVHDPIMPKGFRTLEDACVMKDGGIYKMWFSWTDARLIAYCESPDGLHWEYPTVVLPAITGSKWEGHRVSRPCVIKVNNIYHMWYCGSMFATEFSLSSSCIGYACSSDGIQWERRETPVLFPEESWEGKAVTYPHVHWDENEKIYKLWYSAGEIRGADAIGYATSKDGIHWKKYGQNPIFTHRDGRYFEVSKVEGSYVIQQNGWYYMFYMGVDGDGITCIGIAKSKDGISNWIRHPSNPIYAATDGGWDWLGVRGPSVLVEENTIKMWYTGLDRGIRTLGMIEHPGTDLSFEENEPDERGNGECHGEPNYRINTCIARF